MTIPQIITRARISEYLSATSIVKSGLWGGGTPNYLPNLIREVRITVQRMYALNPDETNLLKIANYLYALCGGFGITAAHISGSGGTVAPSVPASFTPIPDFFVDGTTYIITGQSTKVISGYVGYGMNFIRNGVPQSTANAGDGSSYFSWNKTTGVFICTPVAVETELFQLIATI